MTLRRSVVATAAAALLVAATAALLATRHSHKAVRTAAQGSTCRPGQLAVSYHGGTGGGGNDFGALWVANTTKRDCRLSGRVTLTPLDASGRRMKIRPTWKHTVALHRILMRGREESRSHVSYALIVAGDLRDPDGASSCAPSALIVPAWWRLTGALHAEVRNHDPTPGPHKLGRELSACADHGVAMLLNVGDTKP